MGLSGSEKRADSRMIKRPTVKQLQKLPLRAIVWYALRGARRVCGRLYEDMGKDVVEEALSVAERVTVALDVSQSDVASPLLAAGRMARALTTLTTPEKKRAALAVISTETAAYAAIQGAVTKRKRRARYYARYAADSAESAVAAGDYLEAPAACTAAEAACKDYQSLVWLFGEQQSGVLGEPIDVKMLQDLAET